MPPPGERSRMAARNAAEDTRGERWQYTLLRPRLRARAPRTQVAPPSYPRTMAKRVNRSRKPAKQRAKKAAPRARARSGTAKPTSARPARTAAKKPPKPAALLLYLYGITRAKAESPRVPGVDGGAAIEA